MILYCIVTSFLNAVASVVLGIAVLFQSPARRQSNLFAWFTLSFSAWSFFYFLWQFAETAEQALLYTRLLLGASTFIPISYYHFVSRLTGSTRRAEIRLGYIASVVIAAFTPTPYLVRLVEPELSFPFWPKGGPVFIPYILLFSYFTVRAWMVLFAAYRASTHSQHNQLRYVMLSTVLGWIGGLTNFLLWFDIPIPPIGNGLALIYILGVGYAMIRFRLVPMNRLVVRLVAYGAVVVIVSSIIPLVFWSAAGLTRQAVLPDGLFVACAVFSAGWMFVAMQFLKNRVDRLLEDTLLREEILRRNRLRSLAQRITTIGSEEEMFEEVIQAIGDALDTGGAAVVVRNELEVAFTPKAVQGFPPGFKETFLLESTDPLLTFLELTRAPALLEELVVGDSPDLAACVRRLSGEHGIAAAIPIRADATFFGALFLRPRTRNQLFAESELSVLDAICLQMGLNLRSRQLERRASQTEKLISLGTLAAGLAHELRNPLTSIQTFASLLKENDHDLSFQREFAEIMQRDVARIVGIVENISSFASRGTVKFNSLQMGEVVLGAHDITRTAFLGAGVEFRFQNRTVAPVYGNYNQLLQVFINLFQNAVEAMQGKSDAWVEVTMSDSMRQLTSPSIEVTVRDNGPGMTPEILARIFDPFVTTKSTGARAGSGGMGLGLAIVKRVIDVHHGVIHAKSTRGAGTEFIISLPVTASTS